MAAVPQAPHLIRAGYGLYFNGSVYNAAASRAVAAAAVCEELSREYSPSSRVLTIEDGFLGGSTKEITNTYAIDRGYQVGLRADLEFLQSSRTCRSRCNRKPAISGRREHGSTFSASPTARCRVRP